MGGGSLELSTQSCLIQPLHWACRVCCLPVTQADLEVILQSQSGLELMQILLPQGWD